MKNESNLARVSLTGAGDGVDTDRMEELSDRYPCVEWGVLSLQEREGQGRNPTRAWRLSCLAALKGRSNMALHLCGKANFERLLSEGVWDELGEYERIQANINSREKYFDKESVMRVWEILATQTRGLIIQMHEHVEPWAMEFLARKASPMRIDVLFDESKGRGVSPESWRPSLAGARCGFAGGLGPDNVAASLPKIAEAAKIKGCWIDMETKLRTGGVFDLDKCETVLAASEPWMA